MAGLAIVSCGGAAPSSDVGSGDGGTMFSLPTVAARCAMPGDRSTHTLSIVDPVPVLALARGARDLGLVYVARTPFPRLAHFFFQRLTLDGSVVGDPIVLGPIDMTTPAPVTIAYVDTSYLACTIAVGGASCFRVDDAGASSAEPMVLDATAIDIAFGIGGVMGAWLDAGALKVGPLDAPTGTIATTDAPPSIAATDAAYVVGYAAASQAYVVWLDRAGRAATPLAIGSASSTAHVAVAFSSGVVGATWVEPSGDVVFSLVRDGAPRALALGARSSGHVSIARASDGFFATWSDVGGSIRGTFVDLTGATSGAYTHPVGWTDDAHAVVGLADGLALATNTTMSATPVDVAVVGCP